jgi:hypothetical protein
VLGDFVGLSMTCIAMLIPTAVALALHGLGLTTVVRKLKDLH